MRFILIIRDSDDNTFYICRERENLEGYFTKGEVRKVFRGEWGQWNSESLVGSFVERAVAIKLRGRCTLRAIVNDVVFTKLEQQFPPMCTAVDIYAKAFRDVARRSLLNSVRAFTPRNEYFQELRGRSRDTENTFVKWLLS